MPSQKDIVQDHSQKSMSIVPYNSLPLRSKIAPFCGSLFLIMRVAQMHNKIFPCFLLVQYRAP